MKNIIHYILFGIKNPLSFRLIYLFEKVGKFLVIQVNKFWFHIPFFFLLRKDYMLENSDGKWLIKQWSDHDTLVSPLFETEMRKEFFLDTPWYFIDIGAHVGKWSINVARQNPDNKVLAIEANMLTFSYLEKNIEWNHLQHQITPIHIWVSSKKWKLEFEYDTLNTWMSWVSLWREWKNIKKLEVESDTLDDVLQSQKIPYWDVRLIKIDVEWHEYEVFQGMKDFLSKKEWPMKIICEIFAPEDVKNKTVTLLQDFGYSLRFAPGDTVDHIFYKN